MPAFVPFIPAVIAAAGTWAPVAYAGWFAAAAIVAPACNATHARRRASRKDRK